MSRYYIIVTWLKSVDGTDHPGTIPHALQSYHIIYDDATCPELVTKQTIWKDDIIGS